MITPQPLFLATQDYGGAGIAAYRLLDALKSQNIDVSLLNYYKTKRHPASSNVLSKTSGFEKLWLRATMTIARRQSDAYSAKHKAMWSSNRLSSPIHRIINRTSANLLHFHWIGNNFIPLATFPKLNKPIIWTLHDMWAFTGGCHYTNNCRKYESHCRTCPLLDNSHPHDTSYQVFAAKLKHWQNVPMTIITPSRWLADCARQSTLLNDKTIEVIPNMIDTYCYQPLNKQFARQALQLAPDKKYIVFGAGDLLNTTKGLHHLLEALEQIPHKQDWELILFGWGDVSQLTIPLPYHSMGIISDERLLALIYNAADIAVVPSIEEAFGQVAAEALACGTPAVTFATSGLLDIIDHQKNGYLAELFNTHDLAQGIDWLLSKADAKALSHNARQKVLDNFSIEVVAKQYINIYERILNNTESVGA